MLALAPMGIFFGSSLIGIVLLVAIILGIAGIRKEKKKIATAGLVLGVIGMIALFALLSLSAARSKARDQRAQTLEVISFQNVDTNLLAKKPFVSTEGKFQINFPDKWTNTPLQNGTAVALELSADASNEVIIDVASQAGNTSLEDFVLASKANLKRQGYTVIYLEEKRATINGQEARILVGKANADGQVMYQESLLVSANGRLYMFVGTAPESRWFDARKNFEASFSTLKILP